jgi:precorrin-6B methylase 2
MATVQDAIELLRDPSNLRHLSDGDSTHGMAVRSDEVIQQLRVLGVSSKQEALSLIRQAARALGGDELIVQRAEALRADNFGTGGSRAVPAFWIPVPRDE